MDIKKDLAWISTFVFGMAWWGLEESAWFISIGIIIISSIFFDLILKNHKEVTITKNNKGKNTITIKSVKLKDM